MTLKNTPFVWGSGAKFFHWTMALIVIGLLCLGLYMTSVKISPGVLKLFFLHKSFGITVLILAVLRILWKMINVRPQHLPSHKGWEKALAMLTHGFLYLCLFIMPLSGWIMSSAKNFHVSFFNLFVLPDLVLPDKGLAHFMEDVHETLAWCLIAALVLHAAGAIKHHLVDRDSTLRRMLPFTKTAGE